LQFFEFGKRTNGKYSCPTVANETLYGLAPVHLGFPEYDESINRHESG
jgi:hypothetical protein